MRTPIAARLALILIGVAVLLLGGPGTERLGWALIAVALISELVATAVFLRRDRDGGRPR